MMHKFPAMPATTIPKIAFGRGSYLTDENGKSYIDGSGGPAVYCIGHGNEEVNAAITAQLGRVAHGYRQTFSSDALEELTEIVTHHCGGDLRHVLFNTGGSEAVESALKLALQYQWMIGQKSRRKFIARERSWHGNTLGALGVSGFKQRRDVFVGAFVDAVRISAVNAYRPLAGDSLAEAGAVELEETILREGAQNIAGFIFEPVVGAAGGCVPAPEGYAKRIREICTRYGVLMIADEVMCGAGRTGVWRALTHDGAEPDIMTVAKGLAGGYLPLGATIYSRALSEAIGHEPMTGHTFTAHTACCAAGVAVQRIVARENLVGQVAAGAAKLRWQMAKALQGVAEIGDIRGRGYFQAIELVQDANSKTSFPAEFKLHQRIRLQALENGLICYPIGGNVDGSTGDIVIIAPPYNASEAEISEICDKLGQSVKQVMATL